MREIWRDIVGYEGLYCVSNLGRVKRLSRTITTSHNIKRVYKEYIYSFSPNRKNYITITLRKDKIKESKYIHRLVAEAFLENHNNLPDVNHKNGIKNDNMVKNLEWVSKQDNAIHSIYVLGRPAPRPKRKVKCLETGIEYASICEAERLTGIPRTNIGRVASGKTRSTRGYHWEYV